jgi:hypothetical protein
MANVLRTVTMTARALDVARAQRDSAIIAAVQAGHTLGVTGKAAGMTRQAVHQLLRRHGYQLEWETRGRTGAYVIKSEGT